MPDLHDLPPLDELEKEEGDICSPVGEDVDADTLHPSDSVSNRHWRAGERVPEKPRPDIRIELKKNDAYDELPYSYTKFSKWTMLTIIFLVQTSMNFNTS